MRTRRLHPHSRPSLRTRGEVRCPVTRSLSTQPAAHLPSLRFGCGHYVALRASHRTERWPEQRTTRRPHCRRRLAAGDCRLGLAWRRTCALATCWTAAWSTNGGIDGTLFEARPCASQALLTWGPPGQRP